MLGSESKNPPVESSVELLGRDKEIRRLNTLLAEAVRGKGSICLFEGEAGIGKTALLSEGAQGAQKNGFLVLSGRCFHDQEMPPYWPWIEILRENGKSIGLGAILETFGDDSGFLFPFLPGSEQPAAGAKRRLTDLKIKLRKMLSVLPIF